MTYSINPAPIQLTMDRLELRFVPVGDRYAHLVGLVDGEQFIPLFESVEGGASADWPDSPPLQEVHCEPREGAQPLALCIGMAGVSHWSLSVELRPAERLILFDAACRIQQPLPREHSPQRFPLGSAYHGHVPVDMPKPDRVELRHGDDLFVVEALPPEQGATGRLTMDFDSWRIEPTGWIEGPLPRTLRWRYSLRQVSAGG